MTDDTKTNQKGSIEHSPGNMATMAPGYKSSVLISVDNRILFGSVLMCLTRKLVLHCY